MLLLLVPVLVLLLLLLLVLLLLLLLLLLAPLALKRVRLACEERRGEGRRGRRSEHVFN